ncbi:MAG: hypothetical protein HY074_06755 [Deltaproteobacteria bacterium]|nr:hypothetical protein [Deltaproteobacteria bacterium]
MKNYPILSWALVLAMALPSAAFADICQKDSPARIHMVEAKDKSLAFVFLTGQIEAPATVGPNTFFTIDELNKKRDIENTAAGRVSAGDTGATLGVLGLIVVLSGGSPSDRIVAGNISAPSGASAETRIRGEEAKENLTVLGKGLFSTSSSCIYVPSIDKHREILTRVLNDTYGERFKLGSDVRNSKVEHDVVGEKSVSSAVKPASVGKQASGKVNAN